MTDPVPRRIKMPYICDICHSQYQHLVRFKRHLKTDKHINKAKEVNASGAFNYSMLVNYGAIIENF